MPSGLIHGVIRAGWIVTNMTEDRKATRLLLASVSVLIYAAALITHPFSQLRYVFRLGAFDACTAKTIGLPVVALERIV